nr:hypothetical protein Itr_chr07CG03690 [Ipomoea trifida]
MASVFSLAPPAASSSAVIREGARFNSAKFCRFRDGNRSNAAHISSSSSCATDSAFDCLGKLSTCASTSTAKYSLPSDAAIFLNTPLLSLSLCLRFRV